METERRRAEAEKERREFRSVAIGVIAVLALIIGGWWYLSTNASPEEQFDRYSKQCSDSGGVVVQHDDGTLSCE
jgi:hypothetical protein